MISYLTSKTEDNDISSNNILDGERIYMYTSQDNIILIDKTNKQKYIKIDRTNSKCTLENLSELKIKEQKPLQFYCIFGIISARDIEFLVLVSKAEIIGQILGKNLYKIKSVKFLTIESQKHQEGRYEISVEHLEKIKNYLISGFYFSYDYPLHVQLNNKKIFDLKAYQQIDNVFVWNKHAFSSIMKIEENEQMFIPIIQGYIGSIKKNNLNFVLISRRSYMMGGTRYNSRGVDNNGYVANYVETEQIFENSNSISSFVQLRGSLPFYWQQMGVKAKIQIHQTKDINQKAFLKHLDQMRKQFKEIVFFNLLGLKRGEENSLTTYFTQMMNQINEEQQKGIFYEHADFHAIVKETDFSAINRYIEGIIKEQNFNFFEFDLLDESYIQKHQQQRVIRTNCLDCLDRTNAVQTKIGFIQFIKVLQETKEQFFEGINQNDNLLVQLEKSPDEIIHKFRQIWADNGDSISKIYTGTGATTSSTTRKGEKSGITSLLDHGVKTISRFYINNFDDNFKQEIIDILLNKKESSIRHNGAQLSLMPQFSLNFLTLMEYKKMDFFPINKHWLKQILNENQDDYFFLALIKDKYKKIVSGPDDIKEYDSLDQFFNDQEDFLQTKEILVKALHNNYELIIFNKKNGQKNLCFFKFSKIKLGFMNPSYMKVSMILNNYSIEIFLADFKSSNQALEQLYQMVMKFVDKHYDLIFFAGKQMHEIQFEDLHKNYIFYDNFEKDKKLTNLIYSKILIDQKIQIQSQATDFPLDKNHVCENKMFIFPPIFHENQEEINKI